MQLNEYCTIVALARLCGVTGTSEEIYQKFQELYNEISKGPVEPAKTEVIKRPY